MVDLLPHPVGITPIPQRHAPRQNHILAALPARDYFRLLPHLEPTALPLGSALHAAGERESHLYFITEGIVSRVYVTRNGDSAEFALTGNEGVIGVASILGGDSTPGRAEVVIAGHAYRLDARLAKKELEHEGPLADLLLRYTLALLAQAGQIATCNRHHSLEQRLCRWILSSVDRMPSGELAMRQELIATMLGVRREGVSETATKLQRKGLIRYSRGHIAILDRPRLEEQACECYEAIRREYARLLPPHGGAAGKTATISIWPIPRAPRPSGERAASPP